MTCRCPFSAGLVFLGLAACGGVDDFDVEGDCPPQTPRCHNRAPDPPEVVVSPTAPFAGDGLQCSVAKEASDPDGDELTLHFRWLRNGVGVDGEERPALRSGLIDAGETWTCEVQADDGLAKSSTASASVVVRTIPPSDMEAWLAANPAGLCHDTYNKIVNLCGDVEFCFDERIMKQYPTGLSLDVGFHWDGAVGTLLDLGGDCDGKRIAITTQPEGVLVSSFSGAPSLQAPVSPGTHLLSLRADSDQVLLYIDGALADATTGTSTTPELLGACGPGFILGQRGSYWWEASKRSSWLRFAPFFVHVREGSTGTFDFEAATRPSAASIAYFDLSGVEGEVWSSHDASWAGKILEAGVIDPVFPACLSGNRPPLEPRVAIDPPEPLEGESLFCRLEVESRDLDGDPVIYSYRWQKDGASTSYQSARLPADTTHAFERWTCVVTPRDAELEGTPSDRSVRVASRPPCHAVSLTSTSASASFDNEGFGFGAGAWTVETWVRHHALFDDSSGTRVLAMNEDYPVAGVRMTYEPTQGKVRCVVYDELSVGDAASVAGPSVFGGLWHHMACSYDGTTMSLYFDGKSVASATATLDIQALSAMAWGKEGGDPATVAAPLEIGPTRISSIDRYVDAFQPEQTWAVDVDTVAQYLVSSGLADGGIADEAGANNSGRVRTGVESVDVGSCIQ